MYTSKLLLVLHRKQFIPAIVCNKGNSETDNTVINILNQHKFASQGSNTVKALYFAGVIFCGFPHEHYFVGI